MEQFAAAVRDLRVEPRWAKWCGAARADYEAWQQHEPMPGPVDLGDCLAHLRERVPDAIVTNGAGNHTVWVHRFWRFHDFPSQLAPTSGAMGYGVPAAVAAKARPARADVVCFSGDGDFLMSGQELATAVQYELPIVILIVDNGMYGTIRMHQERHFPGRVVGTDLVNPDFAAYARAFGAHGETVERRTSSRPRSSARSTAGVPAVIALRIDPEAITPRTTLSAIRAACERAGGDPRAGARGADQSLHRRRAAGDLLFVSGCVPVDAQGTLVPATSSRRPGRCSRTSARCSPPRARASPTSSR